MKRPPSAVAEVDNYDILVPAPDVTPSGLGVDPERQHNRLVGLIEGR